MIHSIIGPLLNPKIIALSLTLLNTYCGHWNILIIKAHQYLHKHPTKDTFPMKTYDGIWKFVSFGIYV